MPEKDEIIYTLVGVLFNTNGRVLLTRRRDEEIAEVNGKWQFAGGVIEYGETAEMCLIREFREETGFTVKPYRLINLLWSNLYENRVKGNRQQVIILPFYCLLVSGIMRSSDSEILEVGWFSFEEVKKLDALPGVMEIVRVAQNYRGIEKRKGQFYRQSL